MAQPWHNTSRVGRGRGGGRASGAQRGGRHYASNTDPRTGTTSITRPLVWTPALVAAEKVSARKSAVPVAVASKGGSGGAVAVWTPTSAAASSSHGNSGASPAPLAVQARTSVRRAAEAAEAASERSVADISAQLELMEKRLAQVKTQEKEVRAIAKAHLEREAELTRLLEDLYLQQQQQQQHREPQTEELVRPTTPPPLSGRADRAITIVASDGVGGGGIDLAAGKPTTPRVGADLPKAPPIHASSPSQHPSETKDGAQPASATKKVAPTKVGIASQCMLLAVATAGLGTGLLSRDAATIAAHVLLMSTEALREEDTAVRGSGSQDELLVKERWRRPGLSLAEALDRADAQSTRPFRLPSLLPLAFAMRPSSPRNSGWASSSIFTAGKRSSMGMTATSLEAAAAPTSGVPSDSPAIGVGTAGETVQAVAAPASSGAKRRRIDANAIMCPFELNGVCNDDDCSYQHMDAYLPALPLPTASAVPAKVAAAGGIPSTASRAAGSMSSGRDRKRNDPRTTESAEHTTKAATSASTTGRSADRREKQFSLPDIQFGAVEVGMRQITSVRNGSRSGGGGGGGEERTAKRSKPSEDEPADKKELSGTGVGGKNEQVPADRGGPEGIEASAGHGEEDGETEEGKSKRNGGANSADDDDFLALPTGVDGSVGNSTSGGGGSGTVREEYGAPADAVPEATASGAALGDADPEALAKSFAQAASAAGTTDAVGGSGSGKRSGRREDRYYRADAEDNGTQPPASVALTERQLSVLEARLSEEPSCNVEGWLLLAIHRLPRTSDSASAVLNTIRTVTRSARGHVASTDDAALKPSLRALVKGLEKCEQGQAEELWALYLTLYALIPGFGADALGMAEEALDNFHTSRRMWRLYRTVSQQNRREDKTAPPDGIALHWERIKVLLEPTAEVDDLGESPPSPEAAAEVTDGAAASRTENETTTGQNVPPTAAAAAAAAAEKDQIVDNVKDGLPLTGENSTGIGGDNDNVARSSSPAGDGSGATARAAAQPGEGEGRDEGEEEAALLGDDVLGMIAYLILERCSILAEAGYVFQAAVEALEALGDKECLREWYAEGEATRSLLRAPKRLDGANGDGGEKKQGGNSAGDGGSDEGGGQLPQGVAETLQQAPRDIRCLLWLTALHLLAMGVFPPHALLVAEHLHKNDNDPVGTGGQNLSNDSRGDGADLLRWPREWLSPEGPAGRRLAASSHLRDATHRIFLSALQDTRLLPPKNGRGGGLAPPLRVQDALLPSTVEANAARAGCMAPEPSALEGAPLALALNWLTFCCRNGMGEVKRGGKGNRSLSKEQQEARIVALACCRRFQLSRPDHPALLEHTLLEHDVVSKSRSLADVYREISYAFGENGAAEAALRERGERQEDRSAGWPTETLRTETLYPTGSRLEAVYSFLRFVEARESQRGVKEVGASPLAPAAGGTAATAAAAVAALDRDTDVTRTALFDALVGLWVRPAERRRSGGKRATVAGVQNVGDEPVRRAVDGAKASLFHWADGGGLVCDSLGAERQFSTILFALWVLGGPGTAVETLDHVLSAESFSNMPPERRRLLWLQRLEAAVVLSDQRDGPMQDVREVTLRALADHRARPRSGYPNLASFVARRLEERSGAAAVADPASSLVEPLASSFVHDVLTIYANWFRAVKGGGVDWMIVAEALGSSIEHGRDNGGGRGGPPAPPARSVLALLRWVDSAADGVERAGRGGLNRADSDAAADAGMAVRSNARSYTEKALAGDAGIGYPGLAGAVAALEAATGRPDRAQRILEAALRERPLCSALWESRLELESAFGGGPSQRAVATAEAAASTGVLLRLRCDRHSLSLGRRCFSSSPVENATHIGGNGKTARRILAAVSNPSSRSNMKSFCLSGAWIPVRSADSGGKPGAADASSDSGGSGDASQAPVPSPEVPRSIFLLTNLVGLNLSGNGLSTLPAAVGRLVSLRALDASRNALTDLPPTLSRLSGSLRVLHLQHNLLASPLSGSPLSSLTSLRLLNLEANALSQFPTLVFGLSELRTLYLAGNRFPTRALPKLSDALPMLQEFTLPDADASGEGVANS